MDNGWIKLHRKILNNPLAKKPSWAWLWIILLLLANHDESDSFIWNGKLVKLNKGQLLTGRKKLKELSGLPETTIERVLEYLESGQQIRQQKTTKYRVITILKWEEYQNKDRKTDNRRTTDGQQTDTFKNDKNDKNDKNNTIGVPNEVFSLKGEIKKLEESPRRELNIIALYMDRRIPDIQNKEQLSVGIRRHLRAAMELKPFTDTQIIDAIPKAKQLTNGWTLETLVKILTK